MASHLQIEQGHTLTQGQSHCDSICDLVDHIVAPFVTEGTHREVFVNAVSHIVTPFVSGHSKMDHCVMQ